MFHKGKSGKSYANPQTMDYEETRMDKPGGDEPAPDDAMDDSGGDIPQMLEDAHAKMGGKHTHVHSKEDGSHTTHSHSDMGPEGPTEHPDSESLMAHMQQDCAGY